MQSCLIHSTMEYLVKLPSSALIEVHINSDTALGEDLLSEVTKRLHTVEEDFFGLFYSNRHGNDKYWINLRNKLKPQLNSNLRVELRVKFYVEPHLMVQEGTRFLMFNNFRQDFREGKFRISNIDDIVTLTAHIAHASFGSATKLQQTDAYTQYRDIVPKSVVISEDILNRIFNEHSSISGLKQSSSVYNTLKIASLSEHYGEEYHHVRTEGTQYHFGIGPKGISLYDKNWQCHLKIPYDAVLKATHKGKDFCLQTANDSGEVEQMVFKLHTTESSKALYRCVTEMYLFYNCDTVRNDVSSQYCRNLKGLLASFFDDRTEIGKHYVFDIKRTLIEANDHARRLLFRQRAQQPSLTGSDYLLGGIMDEVPDSRQRAEEAASGGVRPGFVTETQETHSHNGDSQTGSKSGRRHSWCSTGGIQACATEETQESGALLCEICCSRDLNTVFCPCGHASCCDQCAAKLTQCPICRGEVTHRQALYLPVRIRHVSR